MQLFFVCYTLSMVGLEEHRGYIYFLLAENADAVKIGYTRQKSMKTRMRYFYTYSPYSVDLLLIMPGSMIQERDIHKRFVKDKIHGEWFRYSDELKAYIEKLK